MRLPKAPKIKGSLGMKFIVPALALLMSSGCVSFHNGYHDIKVGMSEAQVKGAMRSCPNVSGETGRYKSMTYLNRMDDFFQWAPSNYTFIFKDGVLVEFGEGAPVATKTNGEEGLKLLPPKADAAVVAEKIPSPVCSS
jgi:hypothetical protein